MNWNAAGILDQSFVNGIADAGGIVGILDRRADVAEKRTEAINKSGGKALALVADVLKEDQLQLANQKMIEAFGKIDGLVNIDGGFSIFGAFNQIKI